MKYNLTYLVTLISVLAFSSCDLEEVNPEPSLEGKWTIVSTEILGAEVAGGGSYLQFDACDNGTCTGSDHKASDNTTGTFTYELSDDRTELVIVDNSSDGGNYNYTWDIIDFTDNRLSMVADTFLGSLKVVMSR